MTILFFFQKTHEQCDQCSRNWRAHEMRLFFSWVNGDGGVHGWMVFTFFGIKNLVAKER